MVLSTHILPEVEATCDLILIISRGKIVADGTPDVLRKQAQGQEIVKISVEGGENNSIVEAIQKLPSVAMIDPIADKMLSYTVQSKPDNSAKRDIFHLCVKNNWVLTELTPMETKLEDIFRDLTMN